MRAPETHSRTMSSTITSRRHPLVGAFRELASTPDPAGRRLLLDGVHLIRDAARAGLAFEVAAVATTALSREDEIGTEVDALRAAGVEVVPVAEPVLAAMSPVRTPTGIVGIVRRMPASLDAVVSAPSPFVLVAIDVQDPGNLGSIVRAGEAAGVTGMVVCGISAAPFGWKALRGSMGSALRVPIVTGEPLPAVLDAMKRNSVRVIGSAARDGAMPDDVSWTGRVALLLGGEGAGLDETALAGCDALVTIPMASPVESLNVAAAAAILAYAARRQRVLA